MSEKDFPETDDSTKQGALDKPEVSQPTETKPNIEYLKLEVEAWKKSIDVQQHFNDIELRIRNLAVTILGAVITATAFAVNSKQFLVAAGVVFAGLSTWLAFYFMDQYWYHKLLRGAVKNSQVIEDKLHRDLVGFELTTYISSSSKVKLWNVETNSTSRLNIFYRYIAVLLLFSCLLLVRLGVSQGQTPTPTPTPQPLIIIVVTPVISPLLTGTPTPQVSSTPMPTATTRIISTPLITNTTIITP